MAGAVGGAQGGGDSGNRSLSDLGAAGGVIEVDMSSPYVVSHRGLSSSSSNNIPVGGSASSISRRQQWPPLYELNPAAVIPGQVSTPPPEQNFPLGYVPPALRGSPRESPRHQPRPIAEGAEAFPEDHFRLASNGAAAALNGSGGAIARRPLNRRDEDEEASDDDKERNDDDDVRE